MPEDKITPEEKLLKIIEGSTPAGKSKLPQFGGKDKGFKPADLVLSLKSLLRFDKEKLKNFRLESLNKFLIALCVLLTVYLVFDFVMTSLSFSKNMKNIGSGIVIKAAGQSKQLIIDADLKEVVAMTKKRNIFSFIPPKPDVDAGKKGPDISKLMGSLKLVGILWSDNPQAMIEDTTERKTYLLGAGELIGEISVKKIFKDKVIMGKGDQEWELR